MSLKLVAVYKLFDIRQSCCEVQSKSTLQSKWSRIMFQC